MDSTRTRSVEPIFMMAPLPQFFSIWAIARFSAFFLSSLTVDTAISFTLSLDGLTWLAGGFHLGWARRDSKQCPASRHPNKLRNSAQIIKISKKKFRPGRARHGHHFDASRNAFSIC